MKTWKRLLTWLATLGVLCTMGGEAMAASGTVSAESSAGQVVQGETISITVSMAQTNVSSLGVQVNCDDGFQIQGGQWLQAGLMASYDMSKHKGVFSPGGAKEMDGPVFRLTVQAVKAAEKAQRIDIKLIGKNGTQTVFEETVSVSIRVECAQHNFGAYTAQEDTHSRMCSGCGQIQRQKHNFDDGVVSQVSSCTQPGSKIFTCKTCGYYKTEAIPLAEHIASEWIVDRQPAVGTEGSKHKACTACHEILQTESIPALEPPVTEPPATEPPATEPPVTEPPATEPPATEPPATEPPVTEPPATEPPATEPPVTEPPATEPPATEPPTTEPPATEPPVTEPPVTEPPATEPPAPEPPVTEPAIVAPTVPEMTVPQEIIETPTQGQEDPAKEPAENVAKQENSGWKLLAVAATAICLVAGALLFWLKKR